MKNIQMTLDDDLIKEVDQEIKKLGTTRSAFTRDALRRTLDYYRQIELEKKHRKGYEKFPSDKEEFSVWENEQEWID